MSYDEQRALLGLADVRAEVLAERRQRALDVLGSEWSALVRSVSRSWELMKRGALVGEENARRFEVAE